METSEFRAALTFHGITDLVNFSAGRRELYLKLAKTAMPILTMTTLLSKWSSVWTYLRKRLTDSRKHSFFLTMPPRVKNAHLMHPVLERCGKALNLVGHPVLVPGQKCKTLF